PCQSGVPTASVVNARAEATVANSVLVRLGGGAVCIYSSQPTDVIVDLTAWIGPGGARAAIPPRVRLRDTRPGEGQVLTTPKGRLPAQRMLAIDVDDHPAIGSAPAVSINLTAANPSGDGFLSALPGPCDAANPPVPNTSSLNVAAGIDAA